MSEKKQTTVDALIQGQEGSEITGKGLEGGSTAALVVHRKIEHTAFNEVLETLVAQVRLVPTDHERFHSACLHPDNDGRRSSTPFVLLEAIGGAMLSLHEGVLDEGIKHELLLCAVSGKDVILNPWAMSREGMPNHGMVAGVTALAEELPADQLLFVSGNNATRQVLAPLWPKVCVITPGELSCGARSIIDAVRRQGVEHVARIIRQTCDEARQQLQMMQDVQQGSDAAGSRHSPSCSGPVH